MRIYSIILLGSLFCLASTSTTCTEYTIQDGDTCRSVAKTAKITYAQLLSWNPSLDAACGNLSSQKDGRVCISNPLGDFALPSNSKPATIIITTEAPIPKPTGEGTLAHCGEWYLVALGDDCSAIATNHSITRKDLLFLNPELFDNCTNLLADVYYCVQPVGYISTYPGYNGSSTQPPIQPVSATSIPFQNPFEQKDNKSDSQLIPLANGTRRDCYKYIYFYNDFILWNPSLAQPEDDEETSGQADSVANLYAYPCTVSANSSYCVMLASPTPAPIEDVQPPTPLAAGIAKNCTKYFLIESYNTCDDIMGQFYLDLRLFVSMNPSVKEDCTGLAVGTWYCVSIWPGGVLPPDAYGDDDDDIGDPSITATSTTEVRSGSSTHTATSVISPVQTGMASNCDSFYKVKGSDGCWAIAHDNNIDLDDFYKWNPAVKSDCSGLQPNFYVCVGVQSKPTSVPTRSTGTSSSSGLVTPTPTQTGMVKGCKSFYQVHSGDGCWDIAHDNKISLDDFYQWNPAVKTDCSGLQPDYNVCIGV
ncbi:hypothetical protein FNYG_01275 [Fusarium nygamai]|uniref:LysM domain-containing protein n=1 Tax=Gibberella nygamai TaxID=42673 RepID=A0A2K0WT84_GIBNY|nr:hypothetical protein FNYG_01275 [Fusarium nygamai]